jgi:hypothetical protein
MEMKLYFDNSAEAGFGNIEVVSPRATPDVSNRIVFLLFKGMANFLNLVRSPGTPWTATSALVSVGNLPFFLKLLDDLVQGHPARKSSARELGSHVQPDFRVCEALVPELDHVGTGNLGKLSPWWHFGKVYCGMFLFWISIKK